MDTKELKIEYIPSIQESVTDFFRPIWVQTVFVLTIMLSLSALGAEIYKAQDFAILATVVPSFIVIVYLVYLLLAFEQKRNRVSITLHSHEININSARRSSRDFKWEQLKGVALSGKGISVFTETDILSIPIRAFKTKEEAQAFVASIKTFTQSAGLSDIWFDLESDSH